MRYSDEVPQDKRRYWYFTTHGLGPGTIPKDLHILETREGKNDKGTYGDYICLDGVLSTDELKEYDLRELSPDDEKSELQYVQDELRKYKLFYDRILHAFPNLLLDNKKFERIKSIIRRKNRK